MARKNKEMLSCGRMGPVPYGCWNKKRILRQHALGQCSHLVDIRPIQEEKPAFIATKFQLITLAHDTIHILKQPERIFQHGHEPRKEGDVKEMAYVHTKLKSTSPNLAT